MIFLFYFFLFTFVQSKNVVELKTFTQTRFLFDLILFLLLSCFLKLMFLLFSLFFYDYIMIMDLPVLVQD